MPMVKGHDNDAQLPIKIEYNRQKRNIHNNIDGNNKKRGDYSSTI